MKRSGILLPVMLLALSLPLFSQEPVQQQKYWVTEEQLLQLETERKKQEELAMSLLLQQKELVMNLKLQLEEQETYLQQLESKKKMSEIRAGAFCFVIGMSAGAMLLAFIGAGL